MRGKMMILGMVLGIGIGAAVGAAAGDMAHWLGLGVPLGIAIGFAMRGLTRRCGAEGACGHGHSGSCASPTDGSAATGEMDAKR